MSTGVFLDTNSLYLATRHSATKRINYDVLLTKLAEEGMIPGPEGRFAYGVQVNNVSTPFIRYLEHLGFATYFKNARIEPDQPRENLNTHTMDMTIKMVLDIVSNINSFDNFVIATANPTLHSVAEYLQLAGKKVVFALVQPNEWLERFASKVLTMDEEYFETDTTRDQRKAKPTS